MTRIHPALLWLAALALGAHAPVAGETLLVGNKGEDTVSLIDLATGQECARVGTGRAPHEIATSSDGRQAAVVAYGGTTIDIFDVRTGRLDRRIDIAPNAGPHGIVWLDGGRILVVAERSRSLVSIDPRRGTFRAIGTEQPGSHMLVVSPNRHLAYVANIAGGTVGVFDLRRWVKLRDIRVGGYPEGIAITPDGRQLWVGDHAKAHVRVVDLATERTIATLPTDAVAIRVAITPDGSTAITSNFTAGTLSLFDISSRRLSRTISVSGSPAALQVTIAFADGARRLLVAETGRDTIAEVDLASGTVIRRIAAGKNGDGLGLSPRACLRQPVSAGRD